MQITKNRVTSNDALDHLVNRLMRTDRTKPICVLTAPAGSKLDDYDLSSFDEVAGHCELHLIENADLTRRMSDKLQPSAAVYGGACRVYPMGFTRKSDPFDLPIRYITNLTGISELISDVWANAELSGYKAEKLAKSRPASGKITKFFDARAIVTLDNGGLATIRQELSFPGVPLEWVFKIGDDVTGSLDTEDNVLIPSGSQQSIDDVVAAVGLGNVTLGLVTEVDRQVGKIKLLPNLEIPITRPEISHNERDLVEDLLGVGEVVLVRLYRHPEGKIKLRMDDIDDDEVVYPALALTQNGEPWLREDRDIPIANLEQEQPEFVETEFEPVEAPEEPAPVTATQPVLTPSSADNNARALAEFTAKQYRLKLDEANQKLHTTTNALNDANRKWLEAARELESIRLAQRTEKRKVTKEKRANERARSTTWSRRERFENDFEWFNEEIRRAWIGRYLPADRKKYVLDFEKFRYTDGFFESLREFAKDEEGIRKAVRVILDVVTGRENEDRKYEVHDLREGDKAGSASVVRADGAEAKRAYIEQNVPQARRLHFWRLKNNQIELISVTKHDHYRP
jgi:hypothetical protein